jgi:hypothetical protein
MTDSPRARLAPLVAGVEDLHDELVEPAACGVGRGNYLIIQSLIQPSIQSFT